MGHIIEAFFYQIFADINSWACPFLDEGGTRTSDTTGTQTHIGHSSATVQGMECVAKVARC